MIELSELSKSLSDLSDMIYDMFIELDVRIGALEDEAHVPQKRPSVMYRSSNNPTGLDEWMEAIDK